MEGIQLENGFTRIANELLEKFAKIKISGTSWRVLVAIIRKLYGYKKKEDWIAYSQLQKITNLPKSRISESIKQLRNYGIVTQKRNSGTKYSIGINKNFNITQKRSVTEKRNVGVTESRTTKETITKEITSSPAGSLEKPMYKLQPDNPDRVIDSDTLEESSESKQEKITQKGYDPKDTNLLLAWGVEKLGRKFNKPLKQKKHIADMLRAGNTSEEVKAKWEELEDDKFWGNKGIDFSVVASQIDKVKITKKTNPLLYGHR